MPYDLKIFSGNSNRALAEQIAASLKVKLSEAMVSRFADGEIRIQIRENVRGADVFIIQSTQPPSDNLMELLIMLDAAKRASAGRITAVIPYFGYSRQDRKDQPRVPITAKLCADLIETAGADRVLTMDLHSPQIQAFFNIPVDNLYSSLVLLEYYRSRKIDELVIVAPDIGSVRMARAYAKRLNCPIAILDKRRPEPNKVVVINVVGDVKDKNILIIDDMIDTARTLGGAIKALFKAGVQKIEAGCTHALLSGNAVSIIKKSRLERLTITDTVPLSEKKKLDIMNIVSVDNVFGKAIMRLHNEESISSLFDAYI